MPQVVIFSSHEVGPNIAQKVKAALVKSKDDRKEADQRDRVRHQGT